MTRRAHALWKVGLMALMFILALPIAAPAAEPVGKVVAVEGQVWILPVGAGEPRQAAPGAAVYEGETLKAEKNSRAKLLMVDESVITVSESTQLKLTEYRLDDKEKTRTSLLSLVTGKLRLIVSKLAAHRSQYSVQTPTAVMGVRGSTAVIWTETDPATGQTKTFIYVAEGEWEVKNDKGSTIVKAGQICETPWQAAPFPPVTPTPEQLQNAQQGTVVQLIPGQTFLQEGIQLTPMQVQQIEPPTGGPPMIPPPEQPGPSSPQQIQILGPLTTNPPQPPPGPPPAGGPLPPPPPPPPGP
jgi:hypothetical protein